MQTLEADVPGIASNGQDGKARLERDVLVEAQHERWMHIHVNWTAVWIGALATVCVLVLFGLVGIALGAHLLGPEHRIVDLKAMTLGTLIFSVCGAFFSAVIGGWVAGKMAGVLHSEPACLHGGFVWLLTVPILVACAALGATSLFGAWYGGLSANSAIANAPFVRPESLGPTATAEEVATVRAQQAEYARNIKKWHDDTPRATRNSALAAITAVLLGLIGSVIGGWMASGEPMNFIHHQTRKPRYHTV